MVFNVSTPGNIDVRPFYTTDKSVGKGRGVEETRTSKIIY